MKKDKKEVREKFLPCIHGLDNLFHEGIPQGNSILVEGGPGSGKTILCLQIAYEQAKRGKKVLIMSFEEAEHQLREHMEVFNWDVKGLEAKGTLQIKRINALDISRSVEALLSDAKKELLIDIHPVLIPKSFAPDIIIFDSISAISSAFSGEENRFRIYMEQFFRYLESQKTSSLLIREVANPTHTGGNYVEHGEAISFLSDGIIVLYNVILPHGKRGRALEILKMRGDDIKRGIYEAEIKRGKGWVVSGTPLKGSYTLT
ncbi:MAG: ATPase domain-containing protein [Nanoarchaeota archaeon]